MRAAACTTLSRRSIARPPKIEARNGPGRKRKDQQDQVDLLPQAGRQQQDPTQEIDESFAGQDLPFRRQDGPEHPLGQPAGSRDAMPRERCSPLPLMDALSSGASASQRAFIAITPCSSRRHSNAVDDVANDRLGRSEFTRLKERLAHDPVRQHRYDQRLDVVW